MQVLYETIRFIQIIIKLLVQSVERGYPKPDVVGSNPTERDPILVILRSKITLKDRKSTRLNSSHLRTSRMPSSA